VGKVVMVVAMCMHARVSAVGDAAPLPLWASSWSLFHLTLLLLLWSQSWPCACNNYEW
jgi:hypothetical protein